jgi:RHS repeat-associated protein
MRPRLFLLIATLGTVLALSAVTTAQSGTTRYVNHADATCGGHSPCYGTIQAAVTAAQAGDTVQIQAGTYVEQVQITGKNNTAGATEASRIVIQADPAAAVGAVVLHGSVSQCTNGYAIRLQQSKFITIRGLTITGAGGEAIALLGGTNQNTAIHIERNRLFGNGSASCNGGITIAGGNPDTLIVNNLIYGNGRNGIATIDATGGPHSIIENTIHGNQWSGVNVTRSHQVLLANNALTGNGTASGTTGGRFGVVREVANPPNPAGIQLVHNLVCGNRLGELNGPILDGTDNGNLTPTGTEGTGVAASPGCDNPASVYATLNGPDGLANTADDNFAPAPTSPLVDHGIDPRTLGLPTAFNPLLESDYLQATVRPRAGTPGNPAQFDIGAIELGPPDTQAPTVTFLQPPANAFVRQTVTVQAQATDSGSGVATLTLQAESQALTTTLVPTPPAASMTGTASWTTTSVADGTHTLTATATDQASNSGTATRVVIVDNTPPDTSITGGPTGEITTSSTSVTFTGTDNLTPVGSLVFAWRLDGGTYSAFSAATTANLTGLTAGAHTFEVKARDLAGNEDATPASRAFSVRFGPSISTVDPTSGPIGTLVTITGTGFVPGGTTVTFNGLAAVIRTLTATQLTTTVPIGATTGPLVVQTAQGSTSLAFTVTLTGNFTLTAAPAAPATVRVVAGDQGLAQILAAGTGSFTSLVSLSVSPGPTGITPSFLSSQIAPGSGTRLSFGVAPSVPAGTYAFTVTGVAQIDGRTETRTAPVSVEVLPPDTLAVTGQILTAESIPQPIPGVSVVLGSAFVLTDAAGNFTLLAPPTGPNMLFVDGRTASTVDAQFPIVEIQISVGTTGPTRVPFPIYLPKLDTANAINLPLDANGFTTQTVLATTPRIPGLVVTVPQGTKITGPDGNPVAQLVITPVPVDRSPMPFPPGKSAPLLFAINPGGSVPSQPLPISFPNITEAAPGKPATMQYFDLSIGNWNTWGTGTVSADGSQVVSDPGTGLPRLAWHWWDIVRDGLQKLWKFVTGGDPVDLGTGIFTVEKTDLVLPARIPISIQRTYRSDDTRQGFFGIGWNLGIYDSRLTSSGDALVLTMPDQNTFQFRSNGAGQWTSTESFLLGAVITQLPGEFDFQIRYKDGIVHTYNRIIGFANTAGLSTITDRNGNTVTITRDSPGPTPELFGLITQITEPAGRAYTLTYDGTGRITSVTDPINRQVQYAYDPQGRLETVTDAAGGMTRYAYDSQQRITSITDPRNITYLTNEYDAQGRVIRQTQADGGVWQFAYGVLGTTLTETRVTDPRGNVTAHRFSSTGQRLSTIDALAQTTTYEYASGSNLLLNTTDPLGRVTRYAYDALGNVTQILDPAGNPRSFSYEPAFNRLTSLTDPLNQVTSFEYDPQGNLTAIVDPLAHRTTLGYDGAGQLTSVTDPLTHTTTFSYDSVGNLATIADPLGNTTRRIYDAVSRLVQQTDPRGMPTTFAYDALNRTTQIQDALAGLTQLAYDPNGNLLTVTDARNGVTAHSYDTMDRLQTRTDPVNAVESFEYDGTGNLTRHTDRKGQVATFVYDELNRPRARTYADSSAGLTLDAVGRITQATDTIGGSVEIAYDVLDRIATETGTLGVVSYQYDALGRRIGRAASGQAVVAYTWDAGSRLTELAQGSQVVAFQHDNAGRRIRLTLPNQVSTEYQYDLASRLTGLTYRNAAGQLGDLTYTYDPAGNRVGIGGAFARTLLPAAIASATYDGANRQLTFGGQTLTYDANGNLAADSTTTYLWDARNRLASLVGPTSASFQYDSLGRRGQKVSNATTSRFQYDGLNAVLEATDSGSSYTILTSLALDEDLMRTDGNGVRSLVADALGSTVAETDPAGAVVAAYSYEPFGRTDVAGTESTNPFQFTGRENDRTGLYSYRARYYNPQLQRFIAEDPIGFAGGINLYAYAAGNPLRYVDPNGLWGVGVHGGGVAEVGAGPRGGAAYQLSSGLGFFAQGLLSNSNLGGYTSSGGFAGDARTNQFVMGATAGLGGGLFVTNAARAEDLVGPFDTWSLNLPVVTVNFATDGKTRIGSFSLGRSWGASFSRYTVTTTTGRTLAGRK